MAKILTCLLSIAYGLLAWEMAEVQRVRLAYRFARGQTTRYQLTVLGVGCLTLSGATASGEPLIVPFDMQVQGTFRRRVLKVAANGRAEVETQLETLALKATGAGQQVEAEMSPGSFRATLNGQKWVPSPPTFPPSGEKSETAFDPQRLLQPVRQQVTPTGKTTSSSPKLEVSWESLAPAIAPLLRLGQQLQRFWPQFPQREVKPGETWEQPFRLPLPGPAAEIATSTLQYTFAGLTAWEGETCAQVRLQGVLNLPPFLLPLRPVPRPPKGPRSLRAEQLKVRLHGTVYFVPGRGQWWGQDLTADLYLRATTSSSTEPESPPLKLELEGEVRVLIKPISSSAQVP
ncbi:MAG TPA: hypothetical protein EYP85_15150 [Armatimonadetes bacterium]|nr:hypothetical protein [Armatimonadota bacterium]